MNRSLVLAVLLAIALWSSAPATRADDLKALEGKWKVETAEAQGKPAEAPELRELIVTITGDRYEILVNGETDRGSLKLDEMQKPKFMDATDTEGENVGKVIKAIYEVTGDTLRVCYAMKGDERPTEFATKEGTSLLLITYRREK